MESGMKYPSFEDLAEVVRESARLKREKRIDPDSRVSHDLGITGTHGADLLKSIERFYGIEFTAESYDRMKNERPLPPEDPDESPVIQSLFGKSAFAPHPLTVGQLYRIVLQELRAKE
jgi:hypothetical protein